MRFLVYLDRDEDGYVAACPSIPNCVVQGRTKDAARKALREAIEQHLEKRRKAGETVPAGELELTEVKGGAGPDNLGWWRSGWSG